jgi:hypothetical protein
MEHREKRFSDDLEGRTAGWDVLVVIPSRGGRASDRIARSGRMDPGAAPGRVAYLTCSLLTPRRTNANANVGRCAALRRRELCFGLRVRSPKHAQRRSLFAERCRVLEHRRAWNRTIDPRVRWNFLGQRFHFARCEVATAEGCALGPAPMRSSQDSRRIDSSRNSSRVITRSKPAPSRIFCT